MTKEQKQELQETIDSLKGGLEDLELQLQQIEEPGAMTENMRKVLRVARSASSSEA